MMMSSTKNQFLKKLFVNTNPPAKFGIFTTFRLGVRYGEFFAPFPRVKCFGQTSPCKIELIWYFFDMTQQ